MMQINPTVIRAKRIEMGWTQQQLSDVSGLSLRTIQRVESQGQGSLETCNALCAVLELDRQQILLEKPAILRSRSVLNITPWWAIIGAILLGFLVGVLTTLLIN